MVIVIKTRLFFVHVGGESGVSAVATPVENTVVAMLDV